MYVHSENSNSYGILNGLCNIYNTNPQTPLFVFMCFFFSFLVVFYLFFLVENDSRGQNYHNSLQVSGKFIEKMKSVYAETGKRPKINIRKDCYL